MSELTRREWIQRAGAGLAYSFVPGLHGPSFGRRRLGRLLGTEARPMVVIPAGNFLMGTTTQDIQTLASTYGYDPSWMDGEVPQSQVYLPSFSIQRYPVTNREFAEFCAATGYPPRLHWGGPNPPEALLDHPVVFVSRADAWAYANWAGLRLPTEAEWQKAARGEDGRTFPWGDVFDPLACQWNGDIYSPGPGTARVGTHWRGASPYGVEDLIGNVGEWCADGPAPSTAYIKGGAWCCGEIVNLRVAARNMSGFAGNTGRTCGFRCARDQA